MNIIHISDLHYGATGEKTEKLVDKIINHYKEIEVKPLIINTGDLVEDGKKWQMRKCKKILNRLIDEGFEMLICPGNHDIKNNGYLPIIKGLKRFDEYFAELLPANSNFYGHEDNNLLDFPIVNNYNEFYFIGLDSNEKQRGIGAKGELGSAQLRELNETIEEIRIANLRAKIIVYLHHNPFRYNINLPWLFDYENMKLIKRKQFLETIKGKIDVLLFGHAHWYDRLVNDEKKYGISLIQLGADSTHKKDKVRFTEIDLLNYSVKRI